MKDVDVEGACVQQRAERKLLPYRPYLCVMKLVDSHCHLYSEEFTEPVEALIERAENEDVLKFYMPAVDSRSHERMLKLGKDFPYKCFPMMGLHPCSVNEEYQTELDLVHDYLNQHSFSAIGEIGLDYYWDLTFKDQQILCFRRQIELAIDINLPIVIHSRNAIDECIEIVADYPELTRRGIFHCFTGTIEQAEKIIALGFHLGIGGVVTYKNSGLAEVVKALPLQAMVLETDAPYLAPVPFRGKTNESSYLKYIAGKIADVRGISIEEVAATTTENTEKIFGY